MSISGMTTTVTRPNYWAQAAKSVLRRPMGMVGAAIVGLFVIIAIFAPVLAPYDPFAIDSSRILSPPSAAHWFGTDEYGRDLLSRVIYGSRVSIYVGLLSVMFGCSIGGLLGLVSGYMGGTADYLIQRIMDMLMAFPTLILAMAMVAMLGPSMQNVIVALAVVMIPNACRVVRSNTLSLRERAFVMAARNMGYTDIRILLVHILPNCLAPFIVLTTAGLGSAILSEAALSFLGLGTPPPDPSWGAMLSGRTQSYMREAPWLALAPGCAITIVVFGFNFLGDALRDMLDPHQNR